jgi:tetratricopeptide (TPR) repeat protein
MRRLLLALLLAFPLSLGSQEAPADAGARLFDAKRYDEARASLEAAVRADPRDARAAFYLGRIALVEGNGEKGAEWLERAIKLDGARSAYHHWLGRAYSRQALRAGKLKQARLAGRIRESFQRAVALDPDNLDARFDLLQYYVIAPGFMGGSTSKAREQAAEIRRRNAFRGHLAYGAIAADGKDDAGAERELAAAVAQFPDSAAGVYALGAHYARLKQWDKAFDLFEHRARERKDGPSLYYIGRLAALSGERLDRGVEALRAYLARRPGDTDPSLASAHYRLGLIYERQEKRDLARQEFATTVQLDPRQTEAKEALKRVQ